MRAGDLVFVRGHSLISRLILSIDKGEFSHVAVAISDTEIIEAQYYTKVVIKELKYKDYEIVPMNLNEYEQQDLLEVAHSLVGKWYDYKQIFYYVLRNLFKIKKESFWNNPNALICSELVFVLFSSIDKILGDPYITPNELYELTKINREKM